MTKSETQNNISNAFGESDSSFVICRTRPFERRRTVPGIRAGGACGSSDDEAPDEVVSFRGGTITLNTWREIVQLNFIRHCLQGGFQIQLLTNATLQEIFGADGQLLNAMNQMTQLEKRLVMSKTSEASKAADQELTRQRLTIQ